MPIVTIKMLKGRTLEQKRAMVHKVTEVLAETIQCTPADVEIVIEEIEKDNIASAGKLYLDK